ncbi:unnamed protein product [Coccothraustes coccothraustes]
MGRAQQVRQRQREQRGWLCRGGGGFVLPAREGRRGRHGSHGGHGRTAGAVRACLLSVSVRSEGRCSCGRQEARQEPHGSCVADSWGTAQQPRGVAHGAQRPRGAQRLTAARLPGPSRHRSVRGNGKAGRGGSQSILSHTAKYCEKLNLRLSSTRVYTEREDGRRA